VKRAFKVYVNGEARRALLTETRMMILVLKKDDEVDCVCARDTGVFSFTAEKSGVHHVSQSKEGKVLVRRPE
jgi:hypothetical protein